MINFTEEEKEFKKILDHFTEELKVIRTGRSHASLVENIMVDSYGAQMPLSHVSAISTPDPKSIIVKPWDKSMLPAIESALKKSNLGFSIIAEAGQVRLTLPPLNEERRKEFVKLVGKKMEDAKISLRKRRDDIRKTILDEERAKTISENQKFSQNEKMEKMTEEFNKKIEETSAKKEKELMEV